jgi:hypothetical protein
LKAQKTLERIRQIDANYDVYSIFHDKKDKQPQNEGCFVATRVFGETHPDTEFLRKFRERCLRNNLAGEVFIRLYRRLARLWLNCPEKAHSCHLFGLWFPGWLICCAAGRFAETGFTSFFNKPACCDKSRKNGYIFPAASANLIEFMRV